MMCGQSCPRGSQKFQIIWVEGGGKLPLKARNQTVDRDLLWITQAIGAEPRQPLKDDEGFVRSDGYFDRIAHVRIVGGGSFPSKRRVRVDTGRKRPDT